MALTQQRGNTLVGFIIGLVVGLTVALGLAIYVTKMPIPFMNKGQARSSEADSAEDKKNKDWDPNAPLYGKNPAKSADKADGDTKADTPAKPDAKSADPIADFAKAKPTESRPLEVKSVEPRPSEEPSASSDPFIYFVQAGAFRTADEAETQRAKLGFLGLDAKLSEREQGGRTVYRVRVGPIDKAEAERVRNKLENAHIESAMVRVQR
jgi:cell division protein FtsN